MLLVVTAIAPTHAALFRPNENLVAEGIPDIPMALVDRVNRYTEFRSAGLANWHPTRREMLISTRFGNVPQIHLVQLPMGARQQLTFFSEPPSGAVYQPTKGDYFVFSRDVGGNEFSQNYRYDLATGEVTLLTDGKSRNSRGIWSTAGDRMVYTSTRRNGTDSDLYLIDPSNPKSDRVFATVEGGGWSPLDWSPDDRQLLVLQFISANESYLWNFQVETGEKTLLTSKGKEPIFYGGGEFSADGRGIYLVTDRESEFQRLAYYDLANQRYTYLTTEIPWDVEAATLSRDGKKLAFVTNEDGASVLHLLDTATRQEQPLPKLPTGLIFDPEWHPNNKELGFTLVSARSTADVFSLDVTTNKLDRWTASETGGLNTANFSEPELVRWKSFDGKMISGFLYRPPAKFTGKRPVIINIHGGPESQYRPMFWGAITIT